MARVDTWIFMFGGYLCAYAGQVQRGGSDCFSDALYAFDTEALHWLRFSNVAATQGAFVYRFDTD